jgi:type IV secretory pathway protease TraF
MPVTVQETQGQTANTGSIVTHVTQHDALGRNMALLRPCAFDIETS